MATEIDEIPLCALPETEPVVLPAGMAPPQASAILLTMEKWVAGTELTFCFLEFAGSSWPGPQKKVVRWAFEVWQSLGISLRFREVSSPDDAIIRIGFVQDNTSWSWVGTEMLRYQKPDGRNMNFGWSLFDDWGHATALHEIGHAIGLPHEHQNPLSGIRWNETAVYAHYAKKPNEWEQEKTFQNIIRQLDPAEVEGSNWDPHSVMHYPFVPGLIDKPDEFRINGTPRNTSLSPNDIAWVRRFFPPLPDASPVEAGAIRPLATAVGAQSDFAFVPTEDREFTLRTQGEADTVIVLFEEDGERQVQLAADNDSTEARNATLKVPLKAGRRYVARVRTNYAAPGRQVQFCLD